MQTFDFDNYLIKTEQELKLRNYSLKTKKSYLLCLKDFFNFLADSRNIKSLDSSSDKIKKFLLIKDRKSTRLNSSHIPLSRMPSSA